MGKRTNIYNAYIYISKIKNKSVKISLTSSNIKMIIIFKKIILTKYHDTECIFPIPREKLGYIKERLDQSKTKTQKVNTK